MHTHVSMDSIHLPVDSVIKTSFYLLLSLSSPFHKLPFFHLSHKVLITASSTVSFLPTFPSSFFQTKKSLHIRSSSYYKFGEMERLHMHMQQLQVELADAREKNGTYSRVSCVSQSNSKDHSHIGESNGGHLDMGGSSTPQSSSHLSNGNGDISSFISMGNASGPAEHVHGVPIAPTSFVGTPTYLPPGQMAALYPFVVHQQGVPHSVPPHVGQLHSVPTVPSLQHWHNQEAVPEGKQLTHDHRHSVNIESSLLGSESGYEYESSVNGQIRHSEYLSVNVGQGMEAHSVPSSDVEGKVSEWEEKKGSSSREKGKC